MKSSRHIVNNLIKSYMNSNKKEIVLICIGTPKSLGDSLGPKIGTKLLKSKIKVYGTVDDPIHALNLEDKVKYIQSTHTDAFIIAIDACIGNPECIGKSYFKNCAINPGKGAGKDLIPVGDVSIIGIISDDCMNLFFESIPENRIDKLTNNITNSIKNFIKKLNEVAVTNI